MENWKLQKLLELDAKFPDAIDDFIAEMAKHEETRPKYTETEIQKYRSAYKNLCKHLPGLANNPKYSFEALMYGPPAEKTKKRWKWKYKG